MDKRETTISLSRSIIIEAAEKGEKSFVEVITNALRTSANGELTAECLAKLNTEQITLLAFSIMYEEVMTGGFIQLIHNGYGPFFFDNAFAKAMRLWGLKDLSKLLYGVRELYVKYADEICIDRTEEEFMALYEAYPEFDDYDDTFVERGDIYMSIVAHYVDEHIDHFVIVQE